MTENNVTRGPSVLASLAHSWQRISPGLVPVLAVITAFLIGIPFMIFTSLVAGGSITQGMQTSGAAYSALIEGSTGIVINDLVSEDNANLVRQLAETTPLTPGSLTNLSRRATEVAALGSDNIHRYASVLSRMALPDEELEQLGATISDIERVGTGTIAGLRPLIAELNELPRGDMRQLAERYRSLDELTADARAAVEEVAPAAAAYSDDDLLAAMKLVDSEGIVSLDRMASQIDTLTAAEIEPGSEDAAALTEIAALGVESLRQLAEIQNLLDEADIQDPAAAAEQVMMVRRMFDAGVLTGDDVAAALSTDFESTLANNLIVRRMGNRLIVDPGSNSTVGIIYNNNNTPDDPSDDRPDVVYLRLGGSALLFSPSNLEATIVRAIPYVIAGLAVALGFKAGLFNIGAEGQLYIGATLAVWIGYSHFFQAPQLLHLPLVIMAGLIGGALWGAIPGALKAFTGAHEVITTIMLNFIAILTVDWLIKSNNPVILLDTTASISRTPYISETAQLPIFNQMAPVYYVLAGVLVALVLFLRDYARIRTNRRYLTRPLVMGIMVALGGLFLRWITVRNGLHFGLLLMFFAVWFTDWFLTRTTLGFELRTVGANPDAARYSGMSVPRNITLAMALSGALAGLAGTIQISGVQHSMQPLFFAGMGFDAIAVALLARTNPRNMIAAGLLWGGLLTGAGLMQINANISVDLVRIIQALIIMFIAADTIIRYIWRVPVTGKGETIGAVFSKGWGG